MIKKLCVKNLVIDHKVRGLCCKPYPNHPKGCPNFGKREQCPPQALYVEDILDTTKDMYVIYNKFNFKEHTDKMRNNHPNWSERQITCCLYWQDTARKILKQNIKDFLKEHRKDYIILSCPEACGVDVTETMKNIGETLEWPPVNWTYQIALAGIPRLTLEQREQLISLHTHYKFINPQTIHGYLRREPYHISYLWALASALRHYFSDEASFTLEFIEDPDAEDSGQLCVTIISSANFETLAKFEKEWHFKQPQFLAYNVIFDIDNK